MRFQTCGKVSSWPHTGNPTLTENPYGELDLYWESLKITHPLGTWLFASAMAAITGLFFMATGVEIDRQDGNVYFRLKELFWFGLLVYVVSTVVFLYFRLAKRFLNMLAGEENIERFKAFCLQYPALSKDLSLNTIKLETLTYKELKKIEKQVNRRMLSLASKAMLGRGQK
jgi:hypothetical protein